MTQASHVVSLVNTGNICIDMVPGSVQALLVPGRVQAMYSCIHTGREIVHKVVVCG